jgi:tRNA U34 5-carboxymethylaminomethyl modifying GTPase MnmE/TrmE
VPSSLIPALADPIVAVATAPGRGAVGIVRVSGPPLGSLIDALLGRPLAPRVASYGPLRDANGEPIDQGLALHFPAPHSYTGEHVLELQAHGGPVLLQLPRRTRRRAGRACLACASRNRASSRSALSSTASLTWPRPKRWPT